MSRYRNGGRVSSTITEMDAQHKGWLDLSIDLYRDLSGSKEAAYELYKELHRSFSEMGMSLDAIDSTENQTSDKFGG